MGRTEESEASTARASEPPHWHAGGGSSNRVAAEVRQWARANGCPWNKQTCTRAAEGGHLEVLQWAIENGCPWEWHECMVGATEKGTLDMLAWLNENKPPEP